jgi:CubicO group peptidase (beta-lactamase class C family)
VEAAIGTAPSILCHPGAGGSIGWGDTATGLAVAICHNRMFSRIEDPTQQPWIAIGDAARAMAADQGALA